MERALVLAFFFIIFIGDSKYKTCKYLTIYGICYFYIIFIFENEIFVLLRYLICALCMYV